MKRHSQEQRPDLILKMIEEHKEAPLAPNQVFYTMAFSHLGYCGAIKEMEQVFQDFIDKGYEASPLDLKHLVVWYGVARQFDKVDGVATIMKTKFPSNPWVYDNLIEVYAKDRETDRVDKLVAEIEKENIGYTQRMISALLKVYAGRGDFTKMLALKDKVDMTNKFLASFIYTSQLALHGALQDYAKVDEVFAEMKSKRLIPEVEFYRAISRKITGAMKRMKRSEGESQEDGTKASTESTNAPQTET